MEGTNGNHNATQENGETQASVDERKLFVGGLNWETTEADLREILGKFGEIENVNLKIDPNTGRPRGFAFLIFKTAEAVDAVLASGDISIKGKKVEAKRAKARQGKIFVGGVPTDVTDEQIKAHFSTFGKIVELEAPYDKIKNQRKGFCFITFETDAVLKELLRNPRQTINGKDVEIKKAVPKEAQMGFGGGMRGMPRGGGMMRGGMGRGGPRGGGMRGGWGGGAGGGWGGNQGGWNQGYDDYSGGYGGGYGGGWGEDYSGGYGGGYGGGGYGGGAGAAGGYGGGYNQGGYGGPGAAPVARGAGRGAVRGQRFQPY